METTERLDTLIGTARRRAAGNLIADQLTVGAMATCAGAMVLLLVGTQILDWYWLVVLFVGGAGISAWRTARLYPSAYSVAQTIDRRLDLSDTLSTAFHFAKSPANAKLDATILEAQRKQAEEMAASVEPSAAMPLRRPRNFLPLMALAAMVFTLFAVRYGLRGNLDLKSPIVESVADFFFPSKDVVAKNNKKAPRFPGEDPMAIPIDHPDLKTPDLDNAPEGALTPIDIPDTNQALDAKESERSKQTNVKAAGDQADDQMEGSDDSDRSAGDNGKDGAADANKGSEGSPKDAPKNLNKGANAEQNSLMDKMRDAMANLMSKLKIPQQGQQGKAQSQNAGQQKDGAKQEGGAGQKGEKGQGQQQSKGSPADDAEADGQQAEQQAQAGQGKSNDKGSEAGAPNDAKAGMGKQDGSKELRDAEQVAAMGKLSEIYGKRAQNITGEVLIEVQNSKQQQLRTAYTQRGAAHREAGGEIHRDEVPAAFQHYVQQYFEQVRKGEAAATATKPAAPQGPSASGPAK